MLKTVGVAEAVIVVAASGIENVYAPSSSFQEAVACGTVNGVKVCGLSDQGLVQEGLLASLIAIPGQLDETFEKLDPPAFVMNQGVILRDERQA